MIIGDPLVFAIESNITEAYQNPSLRGLGNFVIYIKNKRYGVFTPDATALGCSFDAVLNRIVNRGKHIASFSMEADPEKIANFVINALYNENPEGKYYFGLSFKKLANVIYENNLLWAPDGDEAFDDGSFILQFDVGSMVRLIGFKFNDNYICDSTSLSDLWIASDEFYNTLQVWHEKFLIHWQKSIANSEL